MKKLRLAGIANYDQANAYLDEHHLAEHKRHYARQLDEVFWLEEERVVSEDWGAHQSRLLQLERQSQCPLSGFL